jgi:hypothetical protein
MMGMQTMNNQTHDSWGNIKTPPTKTWEETHGENFIKIFVYAYGGGYLYGYQAKVEKMVRQRRPNIGQTPLQSVEAAYYTARKDIIDICCKNRVIKRLLADFEVMGYNQAELNFDGG